jgi:hypothetical protein
MTRQFKAKTPRRLADEPLRRLESIGADDLPQPRLHGLAQIITRAAELGVALSQKHLLIALQGSLHMGVDAHGFADHDDVHLVDLAVEIGKLGIGADGLLHLTL